MAMKKFAFIPPHKWQNKQRMKLAIIGDRYDKDIMPLIRLLGPENVITIRIRQAKHKNTYPSETIEKRVRPTFTTSNFYNIKDFLLRNSVWEQIDFIGRPMILGDFIIDIKKDYLEFARHSKMSLLKKMATIFYEEYNMLQN